MANQGHKYTAEQEAGLIAAYPGYLAIPAGQGAGDYFNQVSAELGIPLTWESRRGGRWRASGAESKFLNISALRHAAGLPTRNGEAGRPNASAGLRHAFAVWLAAYDAATPQPTDAEVAEYINRQLRRRNAAEVARFKLLKPIPVCACGFADADPDWYDVDHVIALGDGGRDTAENMQWLDTRCHRKKSRRELAARRQQGSAA